jgi:hypothetical protein
MSKVRTWSQFLIREFQGGGLRRDLTFCDLNVGTRELENLHTHYALRNDIMDHLWQIKGDGRI